MNWEKELLGLYEDNEAIAGDVRFREYRSGRREPYILLPLYHGMASAQLEVSIGRGGTFLSASKVDADDKRTVIPVTMDSAGRTSNSAPHALCDKLQYVAGDLSEYADKSKAFYEAYIGSLGKWTASPFSHWMAAAIYRYLSKATLAADLIHAGILIPDADGKLDGDGNDVQKIQGVAQADAFVRFIVDGERCWECKELRDAYIAYCRAEPGEKVLDYLSGRMERPMYNNPRQIRSDSDFAKLISSEDKTGGMFAGRLSSPQEAFSVGYESSQKVHNALKWLIRKQGRDFGGLTVVSWESSMKEMPDWVSGTDALCRNAPGANAPQTENKEAETEYAAKREEAQDNLPEAVRKIYSALDGYQKNAGTGSRMFLMSFRSLTKGRLGIVDNCSLETGRYLKNIGQWHATSGWLQRRLYNGKTSFYYGIPGLWTIADILYGDEDKTGRLRIIGNNRQYLYANVAEKLRPCIWDGSPLPYTFMGIAVERASRPQNFKAWDNWMQAVGLACSLLKKYQHDWYGKEWDMALDKECADRSYLYGRLLAVADMAEFSTYDPIEDKDRVTNARRYMTMFSNRPCQTWNTIERKLQPYLNKMSRARRIYYEKIIQEISGLFSVEDFLNDKKLDGVYLLGYHSQKLEMSKKKNKEEKDD